MADEKTGSANDPKDIADKSIEAGIADEGAAYEQAISKTDIVVLAKRRAGSRGRLSAVVLHQARHLLRLRWL